MTDTQTKPRYGEKEAGCWFDSCRGIYIGDAIIKVAIGHGFVCDMEGADAAPYQVSPTWTDHEHYHELTDEAEQFMRQFAGEGFWFGFHEHSGDWGLWAIEEE